jgi:hypothetical protein
MRDIDFPGAFLVVWVICAVFNIALVVGLVWVVIHFLMKWW